MACCSSVSRDAHTTADAPIVLAMSCCERLASFAWISRPESGVVVREAKLRSI